MSEYMDKIRKRVRICGWLLFLFSSILIVGIVISCITENPVWYLIGWGVWAIMLFVYLWCSSYTDDDGKEQILWD